MVQKADRLVFQFLAFRKMISKVSSLIQECWLQKQAMVFCEKAENNLRKEWFLKGVKSNIMQLNNV